MKPDDNSETILDAGYDKEETQQQRLITVLGELEDEVEKQNSFGHVFVRGALYGLGTVIGATILLALLGSIIAVAVTSLGIRDIPVVGDFIEKIIVEQINSQ
jgi:hypothetical protein